MFSNTRSNSICRVFLRERIFLLYNLPRSMFLLTRVIVVDAFFFWVSKQGTTSLQYIDTRWLFRGWRDHAGHLDVGRIPWCISNPNPQIPRNCWCVIKFDAISLHQAGSFLIFWSNSQNSGVQEINFFIHIYHVGKYGSKHMWVWFWVEHCNFHRLVEKHRRLMWSLDQTKRKHTSCLAMWKRSLGFDSDILEWFKQEHIRSHPQNMFISTYLCIHPLAKAKACQCVMQRIHP